MTDDESLEYRSVEPMAVVAALLGVASPAALLHPVLCVVPILGLLAATVALVRIRREQLRSGVALALVGLGLGSFFLGMPLARYAALNLILPRQARPVADEFLALLQQGKPQEAMLLYMPPDFRPPADDGLWSYYRHDDESRNQLLAFVQDPPIRMLLALGQDAEIRLYKANALVADRDRAFIDYWYTVSFTDDDDQRKTMIFGVLLERGPVMDETLNPWRVQQYTTELKLDRQRI